MCPDYSASPQEHGQGEAEGLTESWSVPDLIIQGKNSCLQPKSSMMATGDGDDFEISLWLHRGWQGKERAGYNLGEGCYLNSRDFIKGTWD